MTHTVTITCDYVTQRTPAPPVDYIKYKYRVRHKSVNTPLSHERLVGGLQDGGRSTHVTLFVQLYPQPLYTASQVRTTCRSWDEGVLTDVCLTGVLTDLCLTLYIGLITSTYTYINICTCVHIYEYFKIPFRPLIRVLS